MHRTHALIFLAGMLPASIPSALGAQYPTHPVRVIVPLAAGGGMDAVTRALSQKLGDAMGQTFVVDNRPGAGNQIGLDIVASAEPDGYTIMMISATTVIHPLLYGSRHDVLRDFMPISQATAQGYGLVIHPSIPAKSVPEFVTYLKARPGQVNFASSGIGSPIHMTGELFQIATGTKMTHVPFKGLGAAYTDLVAGRVQSAFATVISSLPHVHAGRLRALAVSTPQRVSAMPNVPTLTEAGVPVTVVNWYGLIGPKRLSPRLQQTLSAEVAKAMHSADMEKRLAGEGSNAVGSSPAEFTAHLKREQEQWRKVIAEAGIREKLRPH
ncbi:MAG TPA: tripartite tricarboxylate transporter substrate binding protein [Burkholderiales bacterium]|nr:tripartite tricarboxylate transporter substrate binding protein [Burkholderiales bacterium]